ncbi:unnamed protein product [Leuciscus chuanchicus]
MQTPCSTPALELSKTAEKHPNPRSRRSSGLQVPRPVGCSQSRGSRVGGVESRTGMCVPDRASAVLVRDKKTRRHHSCGSPVPRRLLGYRPPNLRRITCGKHAPSVTLEN